MCWVAFLAFNGLFNYFACVLTDPGSHTSLLYKELAGGAGHEEAFEDQQPHTGGVGTKVHIDTSLLDERRAQTERIHLVMNERNRSR